MKNKKSILLRIIGAGLTIGGFFILMNKKDEVKSLYSKLQKKLKDIRGESKQEAIKKVVHATCLSQEICNHIEESYGEDKYLDDLVEKLWNLLG